MLIDITRELSESTSVYPGDRPFSRGYTASFSAGDSCNVSAVAGSSHAGTHVDLAAHLWADNAMTPLDAFLGPALVIEVVSWDALVLVSAPRGARVLFKTESILTSSAAHWLVEQRILLVGVETASVDSMDNHDLPNHRLLLGADIAILENLDLTGVCPGEYELIALPLKIPGADATWVRAVLRT